jgi:RimJ/RimL family protein N-acetyltransferase
VIETERLRLVELTVNEAEAILEGRSSRDYADGYPGDGTLVAAAIVAKSNGALAPWTTYQVRLRDDDRVVAGVGFIDAPDGDGRVHVRFTETDEARAGEHTAEALAALIDFARAQGAARVVAETADPRMAEAYLAAGMTSAGICGGLRRFEA